MRLYLMTVAEWASLPHHQQAEIIAFADRAVGFLRWTEKPWYKIPAYWNT